MCCGEGGWGSSSAALQTRPAKYLLGLMNEKTEEQMELVAYIKSGN